MAKSSKKRGRKKTSKRKNIKSKSGKSSGGKITRVKYESTKEIKFEKALVDNFIALQKVMVNLSLKFDSLSTQISKLLELFEISARALAKKDFEPVRKTEEMGKVVEKLDNLAQQAGLIGRGLSLIHEVSKERQGGINTEQKFFQQPRQMPMQKPMMPQRMQMQQKQGYQKSIASSEPEPKTFPVSKPTEQNQRRGTNS